MSLWSPAARDAYRARLTPKTAPRTELPQKPAPAPKPSPARLQHRVDSFTPSAPQGRGLAKKPELNPQPVRTGFDHPIAPSEVPDKKRGTGVLTLNTATGAGEQYNSAENRRAQAELIKESSASIVAFQEVDVNVERSKREEDGPHAPDRNTALDIVAQVDSSFGVFLRDEAPRVDIHEPTPPPTSVRAGEDGTTIYQTPGGALVTSESFSGDDRPGGIAEDTGADSSYGNAIYVAAPERVTEAYTVALPNVPTVGASGAATPGQLRALADGNLTQEERAELRVNNEALRDSRGPEPRGALVTRVVGPDGKERTIINTHVAAGEDNKALRDAQLAYIAQLAAAESKGPPPREVVVLGDFNTSTEEVGAFFEAAGLERAVGGTSGDPGEIEDFDQVWTTAGLDTHHSAQVETGGVSDHPHAGYTEIS